LAVLQISVVCARIFGVSKLSNKHAERIAAQFFHSRIPAGRVHPNDGFTNFKNSTEDKFMNISARWFPTRLAERAAWFQNFAEQFAAVAVSLGFTAADVAKVNDDNAMMQFLAGLKNSLKAIDDAARKFRELVTQGDAGDPPPQFPVWTLPEPPVTINAGIFERLDRLVDKIRAADNYTEEIAALLGILLSKGDTVPPGEVKAIAKVAPAFTAYTFSVTTSKMGADSFRVQIRRSGSETWTDAAFGTSSPLEVTVQPTTPGQPEQIQVRVILLRKNTPAGQPSDAAYVTLNP
jgi:hypothetical protein